MSTIIDAINFDPAVYQIDTTDPVLGGPGGIANKAAQNLANRTAWLRARLMDGTATFGVDSGTGAAYAVAFAPANTVLADGQLLSFKAKNTNSPGATLSVDGLAAIPIYGFAGSPVQGDEIPAGSNVAVRFNAALNSGHGAVTISAIDNGGAFQTGPATKSQHAIQLQQAQAIKNAIIAVSVAGNANVQLSTAAMAGGVIALTGAITANISVLFPTTNTGVFVVSNQTSGAFQLTVGTGTAGTQTPGGSTVSISSGTSAVLFTDGTNVQLASSTTVPTPPVGDNSQSAANTKFVQSTINGVLTKAVDGGQNVILTAVEAGNGIYIFTGVLTANIAIIVPTSGKSMVAVNRTSGAFTVTVKTAAGAGVVVAQGTQQELLCDGVNVVPSSNDFTDTVLRGTPTAPTPSLFDTSQKLATMAAMQRALGNLQGYINPGASVTLSPSQSGSIVLMPTNGSVTLPLLSAVPAGTCFTFISTLVTPKPVLTQGADLIQFDGAANHSVASYSMAGGETMVVVSIGTSWYVVSGSAQLQYASGMFGAALGGSGFQKLPSGLIIQWGIVQSGSGGTANLTFPIAFPSQLFNITVAEVNSGAGYASAGTFSTAGGPINAWSPNGTSGGSGISISWIAFGK